MASSTTPKPSLLMYSNAPWSVSAYGIQTRHLLARLTNRGYRVGCAANWGMMGAPIGFDGYTVYGHGGGLSEVETFEYYRNEGYDVLSSLYDLWPLENFPDLVQKNRVIFVPWLPVDMEGIPPVLGQKLGCATWLAPLTKYGEGLLTRNGFANVTRIPHGLDAQFWRPILGGVHKDTARPEDLARLGPEWGESVWTKEEMRRALGFPEDAVVIGMVQMNKGSRKLIPHQLEGIKLFMDRNPDLKVRVYLHMATKGVDEGFDLPKLLPMLGFSGDHIKVPDQYAYWVGFDEAQLRAVYAACDATLLASVGEGFGVPVIESQACGIPCVAGGYGGTAELLEPTPELRVKPTANFWGSHPARFWIPDVDDIANKLELAIKRDPEKDRILLHDWVAQNFDWDGVVVPLWEQVLQKAVEEADHRCLRGPAKSDDWAAMTTPRVVTR